MSTPRLRRDQPSRSRVCLAEASWKSTRSPFLELVAVLDQFFIDDLFEAGEWLRAYQLAAIDEERRGSARAQPGSLGAVRGDLGIKLVGIQAGAEPAHLESHLPAVPLQRRPVKRRLIG